MNTITRLLKSSKLTGAVAATFNLAVLLDYVSLDEAELAGVNAVVAVWLALLTEVFVKDVEQLGRLQAQSYVDDIWEDEYDGGFEA